MQKVLILSMGLIMLTACSGEGGYCKRECKTVGENAFGDLITECSPPICYDLEGNLKEK